MEMLAWALCTGVLPLDSVRVSSSCDGYSESVSAISREIVIAKGIRHGLCDLNVRETITPREAVAR